MSTLTDAGTCAMSAGMAARMASTVATVFASGWRRTSSVIERSSFAQLAVFTDSTLSSTSATSLNRVVLPPGCCAMMSCANSAARVSWRVGRVHLAVRRRVGHLDRKAARGAQQCRLDVDGGLVDVAVLVEFQRDLRATLRGRRADDVHRGDGLELLFEGGCHRRGHVLGA